MALRFRRQETVPVVEAPEPSGTPIAAVRPREQVTIVGKITRMRAKPSAGLPALSITITDASGTVNVVWTGRRSIGGIALGRKVVISGVPRLNGDRVEFLNPVYTLLEA